MTTYFAGRAFDYNDVIKQIRGFVQGHPQVFKTDYDVPQSGITITGTGVGNLYVSTESYTPAGAVGAASPSGTGYRLTCTVAGSEVTSPRAQFTVEQLGISPSVLGTLTAGERWAPDGDDPQYVGSPLGSPGQVASPLHGLRLILDTSTNWAVSDTIEFRLVDHNLDGNAIYNWEEQRFRQQAEDGIGNFDTDWIARAPTFALATSSPQAEVYYGLKSTYNVSQNYFNVGVMGADGYNDSALFNAQPNTSGVRYWLLDETSFPFWVKADGDGIWCCARIGSVYQHMTMQLIKVFATGTQHPKPMYIGAQAELETVTFSESDNDRNASCFDPGDESSALFRWVDGNWYKVENRTAAYTKGANRDSAAVGEIYTGVFWVHPFRSNYGQASWDNGTMGGESTLSIMEWNNFLNQMIARYDGSYELIPVALITGTPQDAVVGDFSYIKAVTGQGINAEDTTTDTSQSPNQEYIAFQNTNLSDRDNFIVMEKESQ
jgi:hypothetical protein